MDSRNKILVDVKNLEKSFDGVKLLEDISFTVKEGEFCALLGPNGVGKSTLFNILVGTIYGEKGSVKIMGRCIEEDISSLKNFIGHVTEKLNYHTPYSVIEFFKIYGDLFETWDHDYFLKLMDERRLDVQKNFSQYSRGQKMQTALIAALSIHPKLLLIDEVTSVMDVHARKSFIHILKEFTNNGGAIVITTNIISEIQYCTDKVVVLNDKKIQVEKDTNEIPDEFIKIRKLAGEKLTPIFEDDLCFWTGTNSDGSTSYVMPKERAEKFNYRDYPDRRAITLEEIFIYHLMMSDRLSHAY